MIKNNIIFNSITCGITGLIAGGVLFHGFKGVYKKNASSSNYFPTCVNDFKNWGAYLGLGIGIIFGYTKKPLLSLFTKKIK